MVILLRILLCKSIQRTNYEIFQELKFSEIILPKMSAEIRHARCELAGGKFSSTKRARKQDPDHSNAISRVEI